MNYFFFCCARLHNILYIGALSLLALIDIMKVVHFFLRTLNLLFKSRYGEIVDVNLVRDKGTGKSKGFAFVAYEDQRSTTLAVG